jgi:hypothetical protein
MNTTDSNDWMMQFTSSEILNELVGRVGPAETVLMFNERSGSPVSTVAELRARLIDY